jgi:drug/metabolite transporter (DMT)-like permease
MDDDYHAIYSSQLNIEVEPKSSLAGTIALIAAPLFTASMGPLAQFMGTKDPFI